MPGDFVTRVEYDHRHQELSDKISAQVARLDARIDKAEVSDQSMRSQMDSRFDKIVDKIDASEKLLSSQISNLKDDVYRTRQSDLWRVLSWAVSFILGGGGMFGLLQLFHLLR